MSTRTIATIRTDAKNIVAEKITSKAKLNAALPVLIELAEAVRSAKRIYDISRDALAELNDTCSEYALGHDSVFDEGLATNAKGVRSGDITIDGTIYHFASGYGSPERTDGEVLSQEFLAALPANWAKAVWKIDTTGINRLGVSDADLEKQGLFRPAKNAWSAAEAVE